MKEPQHLVAGPLSAWFFGAELREVRVDDLLLLDRLYFAVRDPDWATLRLLMDEPVITRSSRAFLVTVRGTSAGTCAPFSFEIQFAGAPGSLEASVHYRPHCKVSINRIGFCLLHPLSFARTPVEFVTPTGTVRSEFPDLIAPQSPSTNLKRMTLRARAQVVDIEFFGDLFEVEDQRNWIDASYKTFSTPLSHPHPRTVLPDAELSQVVSMRWRGRPADTVFKPQPPVRPRSPLAGPAIGLSASRSSLPIRDTDITKLRALHPAWLAVTLLLDQEWVPRWRRAAEEAAALGVPLDVTLVAKYPSEIDDVDLGKGVGAVKVTRWQAYDSTSHVTTAALAQALHRLEERVGGDTRGRIAGGSRANFAELNRAADVLPLNLLDEIVFAANPQVHAFDDASILQTPDGLADAVRTAVDLAQGRPVLVGPLTLAPMFNAVAAHPGRHIDLPPDDRQHGVLASKWARLAVRAARGAAGVTIYETIGPWGVLDAQGVPSPAYAALADLAGS